MAKIELVTQMNFLGPMFQDEVMGTISHITCCLVIGFQVASDHCMQAQAFFFTISEGKKRSVANGYDFVQYVLHIARNLGANDFDEQ